MYIVLCVKEREKIVKDTKQEYEQMIAELEEEKKRYTL